MTEQTAADSPASLWTPDLELGIPLIDGQHRKLVQQLEALRDAVRTRRAPREVIDCIGFLQHYTEEHFHTEEHFMAEHRYPGLSEHRAAHATFRANVDKAEHAVRTRLATDKSLQLVQSMVVHWYVDHIKGTDVKYVRYVRDSGALGSRG